MKVCGSRCADGEEKQAGLSRNTSEGFENPGEAGKYKL